MPKLIKREHKHRRHLESQMQRALLKWWNLAAKPMFNLDPRLLFAIPNGGSRGSIIEAVLMKAEGVRPGVPDLFLAATNGHHQGLFIELKVKPNSPTDEQESMIRLLNNMGFLAVVEYSLDSAINTITTYLCHSPSKE